MKIKMLRNVLVDTQHCEAGSVVEVEEMLGEALVRWGRAVAVEEETTNDRPQTAAGEAVIETATRPAAQRRKKGEL